MDFTYNLWAIREAFHLALASLEPESQGGRGFALGAFDTDYTDLALTEEGRAKAYARARKHTTRSGLPITFPLSPQTDAEVDAQARWLLTFLLVASAEALIDPEWGEPYHFAVSTYRLGERPRVSEGPRLHHGSLFRTRALMFDFLKSDDMCAVVFRVSFQDGTLSWSYMGEWKGGEFLRLTLPPRS